MKEELDKSVEHLRMLRAASKRLELEPELAKKEREIAELELDIRRMENDMFDVLRDGIRSEYPAIPPEIARSLCEIAWRHTGIDVTPEHYTRAINAACSKWLELHWKLPEGYRALSFAEWIDMQGGVSFFDDIAEIMKTTTDRVAAILGRMTGEDKIRFVQAADGQPGVFVAKVKGRHGSDSVDWPDEEKEIADLLLSKFETEGEFDAVRGEIAPNVDVEEWAGKSSRDFAKIAAEAGLSKRVTLAVLTDFQKNGNLIITWLEQTREFKLHLRVRDVETMTESQKRVARALEQGFDSEVNGRVRLSDIPIRATRTYAEAIEKQYAALNQLSAIARKGRAMGGRVLGLNVSELAETDVEALRIADTFCWFADPINAVEAASVSLPTSARLEKEHAPGAAGWWYFMRPLDLSTRDGSEEVIAILWKWIVQKPDDIRKGTRAGVYFSLYVDGSADDLAPTPTTKFLWIEGESIGHLLQRTEREYASRYGPGGDLAKHATEGILQGLSKTLGIVERVARFFAAGCLWMEQKILVSSGGRIERHARKRMERETFSRPLNDIQIIQLRRRTSGASQSLEPETGSRNWQCRWVVSGHWRNQFYPSKGAYSPKWIEPYDKGPDGLPFKVPSHKVYAVKR